MDFKLVLIFTVTVAAVYGANIPQQLVSAYPARSAPSDDSGLGIYDGQKTTIEKHPYVTNLILHGGVVNCSGTIVSDSWVVTIADCVDGLSTKDIKVVAGSDDGSSGKIFSVAKTLIHPKFDEAYTDNIGLVNINGTFEWSKKIKAIKLPKSAPKDNTTMIIAGYGKTSNDGKVSNGELLQGKMKWLPHAICAKIYGPYISKFTDSMNCADSHGKTTPCEDDWADAFVNKDIFYGMFMAGISSGFCGPDAKASLLTNIAPLAPWIKQNTGALYEDEF